LATYRTSRTGSKTSPPWAPVRVLTRFRLASRITIPVLKMSRAIKVPLRLTAVDRPRLVPLLSAAEKLSVLA
jgi:hypothetical protein